MTKLKTVPSYQNNFYFARNYLRYSTASFKKSCSLLVIALKILIFLSAPQYFKCSFAN